jgi:hypothetical protein
MTGIILNSIEIAENEGKTEEKLIGKAINEEEKKPIKKDEELRGYAIEEPKGNDELPNKKQLELVA